MIKMRFISYACVAATMGMLFGCGPAPVAQAPAPTAAPAPPPPPAKNMVMVCRNSQTGEKAACGTPGAVMVGMKPQ